MIQIKITQVKGREKTKMVREILKPQPTEENPVVVESYPYGYLRTQCRFWVESVKNRGDRFVKQTLNPKTGEWNKPKKSTYSPIMICFKDETGKVTYNGLGSYTSMESYDKFVKFIGDLQLNELQKEMLKYAYAYNKAHENVTYECKPVEYRNKETGEIVTSVILGTGIEYEKVDTTEEDERQEKIKNHIQNEIGHHYENAPIVG
jgi:hypothetical protein